MPNLTDLDNYIKSKVIGTDKSGFVLYGSETNTLEINSYVGCPNNCQYCPQELVSRNYLRRSNITNMSFETYKKCLEKVKDQKLTIIFTGFSEPTIHENCYDMVMLAHKMNFPIIFSTTLTGFKEEWIKEFEKIPFKIFWIHLPSNNLKNNILDNIDTNTYLNMLDKIINSEIQGRSFHYHGIDVDPRIKNKLNFSCKQIPTQWRSGSIKDDNLDLQRHEHIGPVICNKKFICPVLWPNGDLTICCSDCSQKYVLGNLLEEEFEDIYKKDNFWDFIDKSKKDSSSLCHQCYYGISISKLKKNSKLKVY